MDDPHQWGRPSPKILSIRLGLTKKFFLVSPLTRTG
jgi:hypothetical protein